MNTANWQKRVLAYNLRSLRSSFELTQQEIAEKAKLSPRAYQGLESGHGNPTLETVALLANTFHVSPSSLFNLSSIRLNFDFSTFFERFKVSFEEVPYCVGLRTVQGVATWANKTTTSKLSPDAKFPFNLFNSMESAPESLALLKNQLMCEQQGIAQPYIVPSFPFQPGSQEFYRVFPTLIYEQKGKLPVWTSTIAIRVLTEPTPDFFSYYSKLLETCLLLDQDE